MGSATHAAVTGYTSSTNFPTLHALQSSRAGATDAFVTQLNAAGTALVYSTYLGGSSKDDGRGIAADSLGDLYVTGNTTSTDFMTTTGVVQPAYGGSGSSYGDIYVTKLDPSQSGADSLLYSTYLGGSSDDVAGGIAVDGAGNAFVGGNTLSTDFPTYAPLQGTCAGSPPCTHSDAFVAELDSSGGKLGYATYLGGSQSEYGKAIAVDGAGNAYVTGQTNSPDFPTTAGAYDTNYYDLGCDTCNKAFVSKISPQSSGSIPWHPRRTFSLGDGLSISVDLADGHVDVGTTDMMIPGRGPDLTVGQTWDSLAAQQGVPGAGWQSSLTPHIGGILTGTVIYTASDGSVWPFTYTGSLSATPPYTQYSTPAGLPWQLSTSSSGYTLTNVLDSSTLTFNNTGRYQATTDAYGNAATLTYSGTTPITWTAAGGYGAPSGRAISLGYDGSGRLTDVQSPLWRTSGGSQGQHVTYGYNSSNQLATLTRAAGTSDALTATFGYSGTSLLTSITTPMGHQWLLAYDANGRVVSVTSPASGTVGQAGYSPADTRQFTYTPGQTVLVDGSGSSSALTTTYTLDAQGEPVAVADGLGHTTTTSYDQDHDVTSSTDPNNNTTTNYYQYVGPSGSTGLVTETVQPAIAAYTFTNSLSPVVTRHYYNATNDLTETVNGEGGVSLFGYDGHHSVITTTEQTTSEFCTEPCTARWQGSVDSYDADGQHTSTIDGRAISVSSSGVASVNSGQAVNYTTSYTYTANGDLASVSTPPITTTTGGMTTTAPVTTTYGYGTDGQLTTLTTPNNDSTTYSYDQVGRQTKTTLPQVTLYTGALVTPTEQTSYDGEGHVIQQADGNGDTTISSYDPQGRLVAQTNPVSGTTIYTYSATEQTMLRDPEGNVTQYSYDPAGRLIQTTDPVTGTTQYAYDAADNTTIITTGAPSAPIQIETRQYDALDELTVDMVSASGQPPTSTVMSYDHDGNVVETQQPNGDVTFDTYSLADQLLATEIDATAVNTPTGTTQESYGYDPAGNLVTSVDFDGRQTTSIYDGANRLTQQVDRTSAPTGTTTITTTPTYDPDGNTLSQSSLTTDSTAPGVTQTHTYTTAYNSLDQPTSSSDDGLVSTFGLDAAGRTRTLATLGGVTPITMTLDALGRATTISEGSGTAYSSSFGFTPDTLPLTMSLPGGVSQAAQYDPNSELTHLTALGPTGVMTPLNSAYDYSYNAQGWITGLTSTVNGAITGTQITHNALGRVTAWSGQATGPETWQYDGNGNIISNTEYIENAQRTTAFTYSTTQPNELLSQHTGGNANGFVFGTEYFTYDQNGDTTAITSTDPLTSIYHVDTHLTYDAQARPITITALSNFVPITVVMAYNALGERSRYTVTMSGTVINDEHYQYQNGLLSQMSALTATLNSQGHVTSSGAYTDTYLYGPLGEPLELLRQHGTTTSRYWYVLDGQGSVVALTDASGNVVDRYAYDLWGEVLASGTSESVPQQLRYNAYWWDSEVGWYWLDTRSYEPEGRFLQPDPTDLDGVHTYVYANDDPVDLIEVGGAFPSFGECWHHAVAFVSTVAHITYKIASTLWDAVAGDDIHTICCTDAHLPIKMLAGADLALTIVPGADFGKVVEVGLKVAAKEAAERGAIDLVRWVISHTVGRIEVGDGTILTAIEDRASKGAGVVREAEKGLGLACEFCFPAGTMVATPHGKHAIQTLHVGDAVLAENPATGKVEAERVQAVLADPVSPLIAVQLSDGSAITVTADHPFWVDAGAGLLHAGWLAAGRLRMGDVLRTANGVGVMVMGLRWQAGQAPVYTLTVAKDHTFFVGAARVLVHNAGPCGPLQVSAARLYHVIARHLSNSSLAYAIRQAGKVSAKDLARGPGESQFFSSLSVSELRQLMVDAFNKGQAEGAFQPNGTLYRAFVKLDRDVGYDKYGRVTSVVRIVVTAAGNLVTIFPDI